jgi:hypothetical protein
VKYNPKIVAGLILYVLFAMCLTSCNRSGNATGHVELTWDAPTTNADGTPISYFKGHYKVYYGKAPHNYLQARDFNASGSTVKCQVDNLIADQRYYFSVTVVNTLGNEGEHSKEISKIARVSSQNINTGRQQ